MWHDIHTKFHVDWDRRSSNIKVCLLNLRDCKVGITDGGMRYTQWCKGTQPIKLRLESWKLTALMTKILMERGLVFLVKFIFSNFPLKFQYVLW
jgi:hypothetical protein